jgi:hypothetical protein
MLQAGGGASRHSCRRISDLPSSCLRFERSASLIVVYRNWSCKMRLSVGRAGRLVGESGWLQCNYELMADMYDARLNEQPAPACARQTHSGSGRRRLPPWPYRQLVKSLSLSLRPAALCGAVAYALCSRPRRTISL